MIDFLSEQFRRNPFPVYAHLRPSMPVLQDPASGLWLVLDYDNVRRVLHDHESFSSAVSEPSARTSRWLIFSDPPRQMRLRALVSKAFTPRAVAGLEPRIRQISRDLLTPLVGHGVVDISMDYAVPLPLCVIAELLGVPAADWEKLRAWSDAIMGLIHTLAPGPRGAAAVEVFGRAHAEVDQYVALHAEERRSTPKSDLLSGLVHAEIDGERLSKDDLVGFFELLLLAGHETTTNLISNSLVCLLDHPQQHQLLKSQPAFRSSGIEEILRYRTPVQMMFRSARRDVELNGRTIPAGSLILASIGSANRDPNHFSKADEFDVTRDPNLHIAFGQGIHSCIGAPLARLESRIALDDLLGLSHIQRATDTPWKPREAFHVHGPASFPVILTA